MSKTYSLRCQRCLIGIDDNQDGDCPVCAHLSNRAVSIIHDEIEKRETSKLHEESILKATVAAALEQAAKHVRQAEKVRGAGSR